MDCKACEEISNHFFTKHLYELMPASFMICLNEDFSFQVKIPKDHLTSEITENLPTNIKLQGPTGKTHEITAYSTGESILLARGWSNFVSWYLLRRKDKLIFFYEGNSHFHVKIFDQNGCEVTQPRDVGDTAAQSGSRGTDGKENQVAEVAASSGLVRAKRGQVEHINSIINIDSEEWSGPVRKRKLTPPERLEISSHSGENASQLANDADTSGSRNVANAGEGQSKGSTGKEKDDFIDFISACSRTTMGRTRKGPSHTEEENWRTDSVNDGLTPPLQIEVISISSGSSHDNGDEIEGLCSPNLRVKKDKNKALKAHRRILSAVQNKGMEVGQVSGSGNKNVVMVQEDGKATNGVRYLKHSRYSISQRTRGKHRARALNVNYDDEEAGADFTTKIMKTPVKSAKKTKCRTTDSVEIVVPPPLLLELISISSGSFHDNGDEVKGQCSTNLPVKKEPDNSCNPDNEAATKYAPKSRFIPTWKPMTNKAKKPHQVVSFRSENPYFSKRMTETNVHRRCCLNILVQFARDNLPAKHSTMILRLPKGSGRWRGECGYSCQSQPQWYFCKGWSDFVHDNNLEVGDWCVFELSCREKLEMKVHIFKVNEASELK